MGAKYIAVTEGLAVTRPTMVVGKSPWTRAMARRGCVVAAADCAASRNADTLAAALFSADQREATNGSPWAQLAHPSHVLYHLHGIVICSRCGYRATVRIRGSSLIDDCKKRLSADSKRNLLGISQSTLPRREVQQGGTWPDGHHVVTAETMRRIVSSAAS